MPVETVSAALSLARRGLRLSKAKRAIEEMLADGRTVVHVPSVQSPATLASELADCGIAATLVGAAEIDAKSVRERLGLTQEQFALRYGLDLNSLQNWESKRRKPDGATRSYLRVIERLPERASEALEATVPLERS